MNATTTLPVALPTYNHSLTHFDASRQTLWHYLNPVPRPVFTRTVLSEIKDVQTRIAARLLAAATEEPDIRYLVLASATPETFSLGGDLDLFAQLIRNRDRETLAAYGRLCVQCVFNNATNLGQPQMTTIALVQGSALGGGFEAALSTNILVAERSAMLGLPEIIFNLFPGMGALHLLARRLDMARAERILTSGRQYSAVELHEMGIVDVLAEDGQGVLAVNNFIRHHQRSRNGLLAIRQAQQRLAPIKFQDLEDVVLIWVDAAMRLKERDLRIMEKLVGAQHRLVQRRDMANTMESCDNKMPLAGAA